MTSLYDDLVNAFDYLADYYDNKKLKETVNKCKDKSSKDRKNMNETISNDALTIASEKYFNLISLIENIGIPSTIKDVKNLIKDMYKEVGGRVNFHSETPTFVVADGYVGDDYSLYNSVSLKDSTKAALYRIAEDLTMAYYKNNGGEDIHYTPKLIKTIRDGQLNTNLEESIKTEAGPYWYFTLHGVGPGSVPDDIEILEVKDGVNDKGTYGTFFLSDKLITTKDLNFYDLREISPECEDCEVEDEAEYSYDKCYSMNESANKEFIGDLFEDVFGGKLTPYDSREWDEKEIELHKSIDWKARNYEDYDTGISIRGPIYLYGYDRPMHKIVEMHLFLRPNPIYPPVYYPVDEHPFDIDVPYVGPMNGGRKEGTYDIHDRYETQSMYDMMFDSLDTKSNKSRLSEARWGEEVEFHDDDYYTESPYYGEQPIDVEEIGDTDGPGKYGFFASPAPGYDTELQDVTEADSLEDAYYIFNSKYNTNYGNIRKLDTDDIQYLGEEIKEDLAPQFKKDIKRDWKKYQSKLDRLNNEIDDVKDLAKHIEPGKRVEARKFMQDWITNKKANFQKFKYDFPRNVEKEAYPFYVTVYQEYPIYEPAEGGYYYAGADAMMSKGYNSKEEAKQGLEQLADEFKNDGYDLYPTYSGYSTREKYIGDNTILRLENAKHYLSGVKGYEPYQ